MKLNLGSGHNKRADCLNIDKFPDGDPDLLWDLEAFPWPIADDSVEEIILIHCLEHLGATVDRFFGIIKELYRVAVPGAMIKITVPHPRCDDFLSDPTHVRPILPATLALFSKRLNHHWRAINASNSPLALYLQVDFEIEAIEYRLTPFWQNQLHQGALDQQALDHAMASHGNVAAEIAILWRVIKASV